MFRLLAPIMWNNNNDDNIIIIIICIIITLQVQCIRLAFHVVFAFSLFRSHF